ncbi:hypothetical protein CF326_g9234 [Tilletia indica]|nr:hypothetical protein CF326_g9234 [Tilletia indica]
MSSSTVRLPLGAVVAPPQDPAAEGADDNNAALHAITSSPLPAVPLSPTVASPRAFSEQGAHKRKRGGSDGVEHTCAAHSLPGEHVPYVGTRSRLQTQHQGGCATLQLL